MDDVLSEGWLPANASKFRHVDLKALAFNLDAIYIRAGGKSGARIRYRRINVGRLTKGLKDKARAIISRMALMICMLAPDVVDTILTMPSGTLGRLVKAEVRRSRTPKHIRELVKRRPVSTVFRVPQIGAASLICLCPRISEVAWARKPCVTRWQESHARVPLVPAILPVMRINSSRNLRCRRRRQS